MFNNNPKSRKDDISFSGIGYLLNHRSRASHPEIDKDLGYKPSLDIYLRGVFSSAAANGELVALTPADGLHARWADDPENDPFIGRDVIHHFYARASSISTLVEKLKQTDDFIAEHADEILKAVEDIKNWKKPNLPEGVIDLSKEFLIRNIRKLTQTPRGRNFMNSAGMAPDIFTGKFADILSDDSDADCAIPAGTRMRFAATNTPEAKTRRDRLYRLGL